MNELNAQTPLILYGASTRGSVVYNQLHNKCNIVGFIDKRADELVSFNGIPVKKIDEKYYHNFKSEAIVIVCVSNIFEHERIAIELLNYDFTCILFCPVDGSDFVYRSNRERETLKYLYECLLNNKLPLPTHIPLAKGLFHLEFNDSAVVSCSQDTVVAKISLPFAYTRLVGNGLFQDSPILTLFPYLQVFDWFEGNIDATPENYINLYCRPAAEATNVNPTKQWEENVLSSRRQVFERMKQTEELEFNFFQEHAVTARWNEEGAYFNMMSGKHRAAYLAHRGKWYVPLTVSKEDYESYTNTDCVNTIKEYLISNGIYQMPYPVFNPYFMRMPYAADSNFFGLLTEFCKRLASFEYNKNRLVQIKNLSLINTVKKLEPVAQMLTKLGVSVKCEYEVGRLDMLVRDLYRVDLDINKNQNAYDNFIQ